MKIWLVAVSLYGCFSSIHGESWEKNRIPSDLQICYRDDPKVAECLKKEIGTLLPIFKNGSVEYNLESFDPLYFDVLPFDYKSGIIGGKLNMTDVYVHGLSACKVIEVRPKLDDPKKFYLDYDCYLPYLNLKSFYLLKGNVVSVPVDIKGRIDMLFEKLNVTYKITGDIKTVKDHEYLDLERFTWDFFSNGIHKAQLVNHDIVDGRPALNQLVRTVLNANWKALVWQMLPVIIPESDKKLKRIFTKFFDSNPMDVIFPKMPPKDNKTEDKDEHKKEETETDSDKGDKNKDTDKKEDMDIDKDRKEEMEKDKDNKETMEKDKDHNKEVMEKDKDHNKEEMEKDKDHNKKVMDKDKDHNKEVMDKDKDHNKEEMEKDKDHNKEGMEKDKDHNKEGMEKDKDPKEVMDKDIKDHNKELMEKDKDHNKEVMDKDKDNKEVMNKDKNEKEDMKKDNEKNQDLAKEKDK